MKHTDRLSPFVRNRLFPALFLLTLALFACFRLLDEPLRTSASPSGIVSFELAGTVANTQAILDSWDAGARLFAAFGLGLDYLFMPAYGLTFALACLLVARRHPGSIGRVGATLAWSMLPAVLCDAVENLGLWFNLTRGPADPWPMISAGCAYVKFALLGLALIYVLAGLAWPKQAASRSR